MRLGIQSQLVAASASVQAENKGLKVALQGTETTLKTMQDERTSLLERSSKLESEIKHGHHLNTAMIGALQVELQTIAEAAAADQLAVVVEQEEMTVGFGRALLPLERGMQTLEETSAVLVKQDRERLADQDSRQARVQFLSALCLEMELGYGAAQLEIAQVFTY
eukprot:1480347-Rhodomonas_salina.6